MNAAVAFSAMAEKQVENIALNLADRSRKAAREFLNEVDARALQLAQFPESGAVYDDEVRRVFVRGATYSLIYEFDDAQMIVTILGCFHNKSDPMSWRF